MQKNSYRKKVELLNPEVLGSRIAKWFKSGIVFLNPLDHNPTHRTKNRAVRKFKSPLTTADISKSMVLSIYDRQEAGGLPSVSVLFYTDGFIYTLNRSGDIEFYKEINSEELASIWNLPNRDDKLSYDSFQSFFVVLVHEENLISKYGELAVDYIGIEAGMTLALIQEELHKNQIPSCCMGSFNKQVFNQVLGTQNSFHVSIAVITGKNE